jgi:hypothetical protein
MPCQGIAVVRKTEDLLAVTDHKAGGILVGLRREFSLIGGIL